MMSACVRKSIGIMGSKQNVLFYDYRDLVYIWLVGFGLPTVGLEHVIFHHDGFSLTWKFCLCQTGRWFERGSASSSNVGR